jgi:hypothetical protein
LKIAPEHIGRMKKISLILHLSFDVGSRSGMNWPSDSDLGSVMNRNSYPGTVTKNIRIKIWDKHPGSATHCVYVLKFIKYLNILIKY